MAVILLSIKTCPIIPHMRYDYLNVTSLLKINKYLSKIEIIQCIRIKLYNII